VIGGGDWSPDRLIPDCIRALERNDTIEIRHPRATRPWQHVLEPLSGYVRLAVALEDGDAPTGSSWNFGPPETAIHEVQEVAGLVATRWGRPDAVKIGQTTGTMHESQLLQLNSAKAHDHLSWSTRWNFADTMNRTISWYAGLRDGSSTTSLTLGDIEAYLSR
jgi:CDP-glucose 4,6-dehydratase